MGHFQAFVLPTRVCSALCSLYMGSSACISRTLAGRGSAVRCVLYIPKSLFLYKYHAVFFWFFFWSLGYCCSPSPWRLECLGVTVLFVQWECHWILCEVLLQSTRAHGFGWVGWTRLISLLFLCQERKWILMDSDPRVRRDDPALARLPGLIELWSDVSNAF